jgi:hypothetical protein
MQINAAYRIVDSDAESRRRLRGLQPGNEELRSEGLTVVCGRGSK